MHIRLWSPWSRVSIGAAFLLAILVGSLSLPLATHSTAAQGAPIIQTRQTDLGTVLTGTNGMTLYTFTRDTPGVSNCNGNCAAAWPPLMASGTPVAAGVGGTLSVITRADGGQQVAYNDQPLYFYAEDQQPGETTGEGVGGVWYVAKPAAGVAQAMPLTGVGLVADTPLSGVQVVLVAGLLLGTLGLLTLQRRRAA